MSGKLVNFVDESSVEELVHLVEHMVKSIVNNDNGVDVVVVPGSYRMMVELRTDPDDVGQVIGAGGRVITAIRQIVRTFGGKKKLKIEFEYITEQEKFRKS